MKPLVNVYEASYIVAENTAVVDEARLKIHAGDFIVLLGHNGSGKSTLIKMINGTYRASKGRVIFDETAIANIDPKQKTRDIVTLTQFVKDSLFLDLTIVENAILLDMRYQSTKETFRKKAYIQKLKDELAAFYPNLVKCINSNVGDLSGGEQQILAFFLYLRHSPKLLLLDEHTSALDPKTADFIMELTNKIIHEHQLTCMMTTHNLDVALKYGTKLIAMREGEIVFQANEEEKPHLTREKILLECY